MKRVNVMIRKKEPQAPRIRSELNRPVLTRQLALQSRLTEMEISDEAWPLEKAENTEFSECRLTRVTMPPMGVKSYFIDVIISRCDLSNCDFSESTFRRVLFDHCRMTGTDLSRCSFQDTVFLNCALSCG